MIILQAAELRILDQIDNLYLLLDPEVNGMQEPADEFVIRMYKLFTEDTAVTMEDHNVRIPHVDDSCEQRIKDIRDDLMELADKIGKAFTYEEWLKDRVKEELANTEDEFTMIIAANQLR